MALQSSPDTFASMPNARWVKISAPSFAHCQTYGHKIVPLQSYLKPNKLLFNITGITSHIEHIKQILIPPQNAWANFLNSNIQLKLYIITTLPQIQCSPTYLAIMLSNLCISSLVVCHRTPTVKMAPRAKKKAIVLSTMGIIFILCDQQLQGKSRGKCNSTGWH